MISKLFFQRVAMILVFSQIVFNAIAQEATLTESSRKIFQQEKLSVSAEVRGSVSIYRDGSQFG
ncbi:hypothetical protein HYR99_19565 [Candidatus Poribacteria bacterium]|nr:hypothetical protein [Candidatus Poribacteria bacterium]